MLLEKYRPRSIADMAGNITQARDIENFAKGSGALIIHGPPGAGKSLAVELAAKQLGLELVRVSDAESAMSAMQQSSLFHSGKLLLAEEPFPDDVTEIISSRKRYPVILECNDPYEYGPKLRAGVTMLKFSAVRHDSLSSFLKHVCQKEGIVFEDSAIEQLARVSNGDVRAALLNLEILASVNKDSVRALGYREQRSDIFTALKIIFRTRSIENAKAAATESDKTPEELFAWIEENVQNEYAGEEMAKAYQFLAKADLFRARIRNRQAYSLQKYFISLGIFGVAMSKTGQYSGSGRYSYPAVFRMRFNNYKILEEISKEAHCSKRKAVSYVPLLLAKGLKA